MPQLLDVVGSSVQSGDADFSVAVRCMGAGYQVGRGFREIATSIKNPRIPVFRNAGKENMMILWNLFWGNYVCQHSSVKVIVLRRQANHNAVPTNTNRKTSQTSVFRGPANSLLTEYPVQHRIRHHIGKQLRL